MDSQGPIPLKRMGLQTLAGFFCLVDSFPSIQIIGMDLQKGSFMNNEGFDLIMQELLKCQQTMELLQAENRELRQQLADLRAGRGICIEIDRQCFALNTSPIEQIPIQASDTLSSSSASQQAGLLVADEPTMANPRVLPSQSDEQAKAHSSTFLEEAMISEFASAMASPLTLLQDPINQQEDPKQKKSKEEQKAVLRRDLMGSYLLD